VTTDEIAVARLEERMNHHSERMDILCKSQDELFKITRTINRTMLRIQYTAYGMATLFVLEQVGLQEFLKKILT